MFKSFMDSIDPFVFQLILVPIFTIGLGVLFSFLMKRIWIGPLVTLTLNMVIELAVSTLYPEGTHFSFSSWNIILPIVSFVISFVLLKTTKAARRV